SEAAFALCSRDDRGEREYLLFWNPRWDCFYFMGGNRIRKDRDMKATVVRELRKKCSLEPELDYSFANVSPLPIDCIQTSRSSGTKKFYRFEIHHIYMMDGDRVVSSSQDYLWVTRKDIELGHKANDDHFFPISPTLKQIFSR